MIIISTNQTEEWSFSNGDLTLKGEQQWLLTRWTFWTSQTVERKEITDVLSRDWFHIGYLAQ